MDDEWFADKFMKISGDLGEIKVCMATMQSNHSELEKRVKEIENNDHGVNKKLVAVVTAIATIISAIGATIALVIQKVS